MTQIKSSTRKAYHFEENFDETDLLIYMIDILSIVRAHTSPCVYFAVLFCSKLTTTSTINIFLSHLGINNSLRDHSQNKKPPRAYIFTKNFVILQSNGNSEKRFVWQKCCVQNITLPNEA